MDLGVIGRLYPWIMEAFWLSYLIPSLVGAGVCYAYRRMSVGVILMLVCFLFEVLVWGLWRLPEWGGWRAFDAYLMMVRLLGILSSGGLIIGLWFTLADLRRKLHSAAEPPTVPNFPVDNKWAPWQPNPGGTEIRRG